jgi:hypothetical protein
MSRDWTHWARTRTIAPAVITTVEARHRRPSLSTRMLLLALAAVCDPSGAVIGYCQKELANLAGVCRATVQRNAWHLDRVQLVGMIPSLYPDGGTAPPSYFLDPDNNPAYSAAKGEADAAGGRLTVPYPVDTLRRPGDHGADPWRITAGLFSGTADHGDHPPAPHGRHNGDHPPLDRDARAYLLSSSLENSLKTGEDTRARESVKAMAERLIHEAEAMLRQAAKMLGQLTLDLDFTPESEPEAAPQPAAPPPDTGISPAFVERMVAEHRAVLGEPWTRRAIDSAMQATGFASAPDPQRYVERWLHRDANAAPAWQVKERERYNRTHGSAVAVAAVRSRDQIAPPQPRPVDVPCPNCGTLLDSRLAYLDASQGLCWQCWTASDGGAP